MKILCVVLMGILGLSGSLWAVDTPKREKPSFNFSDNEEEGGEIETKDEPAEEGTDVAVADLPHFYYQEEDGSIYVNLQSISVEVYMAILEFLDLSDLVRLAQVSQFFYRLVQDEAVLGPSEVWLRYAGISRFSGNDESALNEKLLGMVSLYPDLSNEHRLYLLQRFVEWGADVNMRNNAGRTPLYWAAGRGHVDVVRLLLDRGAGLNVRDRLGRTPLHWAAGGGHVDAVRLLLDRGADLNMRDNAGLPPLYWAAGRGHVDAVRLLLDRGADLNARDNDDRTPLGAAAERGRVDAVRLLLDRGADLNVRDRLGRPPLYWAAERGHVDIVRLLLDRGADLNARDHYEWTPLDAAERRGRVDAVRLLLDRGADLNGEEAPVPRAEEVESVAGDENAIDVGTIYNNGLGLTREQLLAYLVFLGALTTYSTGCNLL